jgi:hypothetical protein
VPGRSFSSCFARLIENVTAIRTIEYSELAKVAELSGKNLHPLGEPLTHDFALHRWLVRAREEAYSDWLQWLFANMTGGELCRVLGLPTLLQPPCDVLTEHLVVDREVWVARGHKNQSGRLDILVQIRDQAVIAIEVKPGVVSSNERHVMKHKGYFESIENDPRFARFTKTYVLLASKSDEGEVFHFKVRTYDVLCRNIRRLAIQWMKCQKPFMAAMALTVAATIETNWLRMSLQKGSFTLDTITHLKTFTERVEHES